MARTLEQLEAMLNASQGQVGYDDRVKAIQAEIDRLKAEQAEQEAQETEEQVDNG